MQSRKLRADGIGAPRDPAKGDQSVDRTNSGPVDQLILKTPLFFYGDMKDDESNGIIGEVSNRKGRRPL